MTGAIDAGPAAAGAGGTIAQGAVTRRTGPGGGDAPALAVRGLAVRYGAATALENIEFAVPAGTVTAVAGPPGSGKSALARVLLGLRKPTHGTVQAFGAAPRTPHTVNGVLVPRGLPAKRRVRDHLLAFAAAADVPDGRADEVAALAGLGDETRTRIEVLGIGEQTRLAIATALLPDPRVLILDDPVDGLDPAERGWLADLLRRHAERGGAAVVTGRSLAALLPAADALLLLAGGAAVYQGTPAKLRRGYPDRLIVDAATPIALATHLAARGYTDAVIRPDGRLAVAEATEGIIREAAAAARVRIAAVVPDPIHPDRVLAALTDRAAAAPRTPGGISGVLSPFAAHAAVGAGRVEPPAPYGVSR
ncbi:ATP-binding cassette domain-containing protein [Nocardia harenae]|uniref:ATP-binding cassette domain-containing protein n=1 Tax=Nocardia harenae TaxID=358707 RepID=UPI000A019522|nr:ATP-binding cassette domain-containing protein [Nocardia harenae]